MTAPRGRRGEPLVALAAVLVLWAVARTMLWDSGALLSPAQLATRHHGIVSRAAAIELRAGSPRAGDGGPRALGPAASAAPPDWPRFDPVRAPRPVARPEVQRRPAFVPEPRMRPGVSVSVAAGHQLLWLAALARITLLASAVAATAGPDPAPFYPAGREPRTASRWSGDGWLLLRRGGNVSLARGPAQATYGASQAGAVLRYRLAPGSGHRPAAYLRATAALNGSREREAAVGLSARILPGIPVVAAAELRAAAQHGGTRLRPAVFAVTEIAPFDLPLGMRGEAYAQAGYVGGGFATAFVDGQLRVDRRVARIGKSELRAGGGVWGGAQQGASRLDIGPTASLGLDETASARLAVDWRFRVAGRAAPSSGPALTLSAGF